MVVTRSQSPNLDPDQDPSDSSDSSSSSDTEMAAPNPVDPMQNYLETTMGIPATQATSLRNYGFGDLDTLSTCNSDGLESR